MLLEKKEGTVVEQFETDIFSYYKKVVLVKLLRLQPQLLNFLTFKSVTGFRESA